MERSDLIDIEHKEESMIDENEEKLNNVMMDESVLQEIENEEQNDENE